MQIYMNKANFNRLVIEITTQHDSFKMIKFIFEISYNKLERTTKEKSV